MIRVVIAEDHAIVRSGLKQILRLTDGIEVVGEAVNGAEVLDKLRTQTFDVLLLDMNMPGLSGPDMITRIRAHQPDLPILVLSMHSTVQVATRALKAGANGYVTKDSEPELLIYGIKKVAAGGKYIVPELAEQMIFGSPLADDKAAHHALSNRELEVFRLLVNGHSVNDIASTLSISNKTVSTHKARLMEKLNAHNLADLVLYAVDHRLMDSH